MIRYIGIYQAQNPTDAGPREAFAIHDDATILGYQVVRADNYRRTGSSSFGTSYHDNLLCAKAEESLYGYFRTAIEPCCEAWVLRVYEGTGLDPVHTSLYDTANDAIAAGRVQLAELIADCTVSGLL